VRAQLAVAGQPVTWVWTRKVCGTESRKEHCRARLAAGQYSMRLLYHHRHCGCFWRDTLHDSVNVWRSVTSRIPKYGPSGRLPYPSRLQNTSEELTVATASRPAVARHHSRSPGCCSQGVQPAESRPRLLLDSRRVPDAVEHISQSFCEVSA
jgi:hypothetical protein